jgi:nucleotide-binding universal stress UspA family protein
LRPAILLAVTLLWQTGDFNASRQDPGPLADPQHLRYERELVVANRSSGVACAVLDATTFAHAASRSGDDLRVFGVANGEELAETPFALSESAAQPVDVVNATVENLGERGGDLVFDLVMPQRAYSEVDLQLAAKDFVATAKVLGSDGRGGPSTLLGRFALFDLTGQHLSRSTILPLQESTFGRLHVELHLTTPAGEPFGGAWTGIVEGATVPASREAQTLYTVIAARDVVQQQSTATVARIDVPAHVPIERVSFVLDPAFKRDFLRGVSVEAGIGGARESVDGDISRVTRVGNDGEPAIHEAKMSVDAVMASNLRGPATITVAVRNGDDLPLPIRAVQLEMRQRTVCFEASAGSRYTLRYGDVALRAPVYDFARLYTGDPKAAVAVLGAERVNADFVVRADTRPYSERHPELLWIGLLAAVAALGATAMHSVKQQGRKS